MRRERERESPSSLSFPYSVTNYDEHFMISSYFLQSQFNLIHTSPLPCQSLPPPPPPPFFSLSPSPHLLLPLSFYKHFLHKVSDLCIFRMGKHVNTFCHTYEVHCDQLASKSTRIKPIIFLSVIIELINEYILLSIVLLHQSLHDADWCSVDVWKCKLSLSLFHLDPLSLSLSSLEEISSSLSFFLGQIHIKEKRRRMADINQNDQLPSVRGHLTY